MPRRPRRRPVLVLASSLGMVGAGVGALAAQAERVSPGGALGRAPLVAAGILLGTSMLVVGLAMRPPRARRH